MEVDRRNFLKKAFIGLGVVVVGLFSKKAKGKNTPSKETNRAAKSGSLLPVDEINDYLHSVFTHLMSLHRRRCHEVNMLVVQEASWCVSAVLNHYLKDFRIIKCEIFQKHVRVEYEATFLIPGTTRVWIEKHKSHFYFLLLGGPGDPTWVRRIDDVDDYALQKQRKSRI